MCSFVFQTKPRPRRSLASRLSGFKPPRERKIKPSTPPATHSESGQSETVLDDNHISVSEPLIQDHCALTPITPTQPNSSHGQVMSQVPEEDPVPDPLDMEETIILILEPLELVTHD